MQFEKIKEHARKIGAGRIQFAQWKHRKKVPIHWQKKIVNCANGCIRFDDFWSIDWAR